MPRPREIDDDELRAAVTRHAPAGTTEISDDVDATRQAVHKRLNELADDGVIQRKKIGQSQIWYTDCE